MEEGRAEALRTALGEVQGEGLLSAPVGGGEIERGGWGKSRMFPVCFFPRCLREVGGIWMDTPSEGGEEGRVEANVSVCLCVSVNVCSSCVLAV